MANVRQKVLMVASASQLPLVSVLLPPAPAGAIIFAHEMSRLTQGGVLERVQAFLSEEAIRILIARVKNSSGEKMSNDSQSNMEVRVLVGTAWKDAHLTVSRGELRFKSAYGGQLIIIPRKPKVSPLTWLRSKFDLMIRRKVTCDVAKFSIEEEVAVLQPDWPDGDFRFKCNTPNADSLITIKELWGGIE